MGTVSPSPARPAAAATRAAISSALSAAGGFREYNFPFWLAVTQLEHAEWLATRGRTEEAAPRLVEAREIFDGLGATPWLACVEAAEGVPRAEARA